MKNMKFRFRKALKAELFFNLNYLLATTESKEELKEEHKEELKEESEKSIFWKPEYDTLGRPIPPLQQQLPLLISQEQPTPFEPQQDDISPEYVPIVTDNEEESSGIAYNPPSDESEKSIFWKPKYDNLGRPIQPPQQLPFPISQEQPVPSEPQQGDISSPEYVPVVTDDEEESSGMAYNPPSSDDSNLLTTIQPDQKNPDEEDVSMIKKIITEK